MTRICRTGFTVVGAIGVMLVGTACDSERSSNPLSPQIAGPLAGVTISSPASTQPVNGQLISVASQPVSLVFANATSNSVRPFLYEIQIATDSAFAQILLEQADIQPTAGGQVTYQIPLTLDPKVYYWRVRALDGANTGPYTPAANFELYTPVVIAAPTVIGPTGGQLAPDNTPTLVVQNAVITGPAEMIRYRFELSTDPGFATPSAVLSVTQSAGATTTVGPGALPSDQLFYWQARVSAQSRIGEIMGPWSPTASFRTPSAAPPPPPPSPGPGSGPRRPDPQPGEQLPLPNEQAIIFAIAAANPGAIRNSCIEEGGSWEFMDLAVAALRATDTRWGYNGKRGDHNDPSVDVVDYFYGIGDGQHSTEVYLIDIIRAVCPGGDQSPSWTDQTQATAESGTIGRWIYPRP